MTGWKSWKIITLVILVIVLLLGCVWFIIRKIELGKRKKEELRELMTLEEYTETHPIESERRQELRAAFRQQINWERVVLALFIRGKQSGTRNCGKGTLTKLGLLSLFGYMAPEYAMQGTYSMKSDVYSFGVLVLEIVSGRKNNSFQNEEGPLNLVEYAWELWSNDAAIEVMDPMLTSSCSRRDQLKRCIHVGLLCLENRAIDRRTIEDVISMLKNDMMLLPMPNYPAFVTINSTIYELENGKSEKFLANGLSMSAIDGR
ncbi:G-type lectin S-receptor-like serine threonine-kinase At1g11330 [Olea europaea subsp. europaea]|uniref:G-type lectin S-receptor-like serine threonine-kinase At1g11330 n=1 Tax=Olea europaea subsp. europaea TaxID=158383 RepID=A0A8S0T1T4_OLEEU|nr:G-type lectin S-receptor-like serine threonine-kinase At1g11330 [Olea europaea subsp. europaea]